MKPQPANLLLALMLGFASMAFVSIPAFADSDKDAKDSKDAKDAKDAKDTKDSKDSKDASDRVVSSGCNGQWVNACGVKVFKTTCASGTVSSTTKSEEADDDKHKSKDKDTKTGGDNKNDRERAEDSHKDHADRSSGNKVSICHRMGGAEVSLTVANDGWLSGHSKHALDTIGRCADFESDKSNDDSKQEKDKSDDEKSREKKSSASDAGYSMSLTLNQIACLKGSASSNFTINGISYPGAGLNSSNVTFTLPSTGASQGPTRGGARTLR